MSATNHTQNYDLSQFVGGDIPSWLNDYNGDMSKIDSAIAQVASGAGDVASDVNALKSRMTTAEADIDTAESNIATLQSTVSTQGAQITQNTNNITTTNSNVSALDTRVTALEQAGSGATVLTGTLTAGQTSVTFTDASIKTTSYIDVYTDGGVPYVGVVQSAGSCVVTFEEQQANLAVSLVVRDFT